MKCKACNYTHKQYESNIPFLQLSFKLEGKDIDIYGENYNQGVYTKELIFLYKCPMCGTIIGM